MASPEIHLHGTPESEELVLDLRGCTEFLSWCESRIGRQSFYDATGTRLIARDIPRAAAYEIATRLGGWRPDEVEVISPKRKVGRR
jgi:hypothetical protein